jgi:hypothetical protein
MKSTFLTLNTRDFLKGLILVVITAIVTGIYQLLQTGALFTWETLKPILITSATAALSYLIKNLLSNSEGQFMKTEKYAQAKRAVRQNNKAKSYVMLILLLSIPAFINAQSNLFRPVAKDYFIVNQVDDNGLLSYQNSAVKGKWILQWDVALSGVSYGFKKGEDPVPFSAVGTGPSYNYYENLNGEPWNVWGASLLFLKDTKTNNGFGIGLFGKYNTHQIGIVSAGAHYDFISNRVLADVLLSFNF